MNFESFYDRLLPMIGIKEIEALASLARIKIDDSEKKELAVEVDSILHYIDEIKKATVDMDYTPVHGAVHNIYREDIPNTISDGDREAILGEVPDREGDFIAVKKIIA